MEMNLGSTDVILLFHVVDFVFGPGNVVFKCL